MMKKNLFIVLILLSEVFIVNAQTAFEESLKLSKRGNSMYMYNLALMYYDGHGVHQNKIEAAKWFKKSAKKGFVKAMIALADMYNFGDSLTENQEEAFYWYRQAAFKNNAYAQYQTGIYYYDGIGVKMDYEKAINWLTKAANQEYIDAMSRLSTIYLNGKDTETDSEKGFYWTQRAAEKGDKYTQYLMGLFYRDGIFVEKNLDKSFNWFKKSTRQRYVPAIYELAKFYLYQDNSKENHKLGEQLLLYAAVSGNIDAIALLGEEYMSGTILEPDLPNAFILLQKAADNENIKAMNDLAYMFSKGIYMPKNTVEAMNLYKKAANRGNAEAQYNLAYMYYQISDYDSAQFWFEKSAAQNTMEAMYLLAIIYREKSNFEKSYYWYNKADELNYAPASYGLGWWYEMGIYVNKDTDKAVNLYYKAAYGGYYLAKAQLGSMFLLGKGMERNLDSAAFWIENAAESGNQSVKKLFNQFIMPEYKTVHYDNYETLSDKQKQEYLFSGIEVPENRIITEFYKTKIFDVEQPVYDSISREKDSSYLAFYKDKNGDLCLANISAWQNSQSFGKITDLSIETENRNNIKIEIRKFIWHYQNTYDDRAGIAHVEFDLLHTKHPQFILKIYTDKYELLIYKGYLLN